MVGMHIAGNRLSPPERILTAIAFPAAPAHPDADKFVAYPLTCGRVCVECALFPFPDPLERVICRWSGCSGGLPVRSRARQAVGVVVVMRQYASRREGTARFTVRL